MGVGAGTQGTHPWKLVLKGGGGAAKPARKPLGQRPFPFHFEAPVNTYLRFYPETLCLYK